MLQPKLLQGQLSSKIMEAFWEFIINRFPLNQPLILISVYSVALFSSSLSDIKETGTEFKNAQKSVHKICKTQLQWDVSLFL